MSNELDLNLKPDHVGGGFEWEREPNCSCGRVKQGVDDGYIFVSNFTDQDSDVFYILPVGANGTLVKRDGVPIAYCPWCGNKITGHKKYQQ
jgi:hypothetical protein